MLSKHFKVNEVVDAIDERYIWCQAETLEFIGEWGVVVRWKEFGKEKSNLVIESTVRKTPEKWNIRNTMITSQTFSQKSREKVQVDLQSRGDRVKFIQEDDIKAGFVFTSDMYYVN